MAAKTSWHRYVTKLRHCHPMYKVVDATSCERFPFLSALQVFHMQMDDRKHVFGQKFS